MKNSPVSTITQNSNNRLALAQFSRQLARRPDVQRRGGTNVDTFFVQEAVHHVDTGTVGDVDRAREEFEIGGKVGCDAALSDAF